MTDDTTVFIVDDDEAVRDSLGFLMQSVGLKARSFESAQAFLDAYQSHDAGCLVLDIRMPGMSGLELQERMNGAGITIPIIFISGHGDVPMAVRALKAGAFDFIQKPFNDQTLLDCVQRAIQEDMGRREERAARSDVMQRIESLTPREREVLDLVVAGHPNKVIGAELGVSQKTVEAHRARVMEKLEAKSLSELVRLSLSVS